MSHSVRTRASRGGDGGLTRVSGSSLTDGCPFPWRASLRRKPGTEGESMAEVGSFERPIPDAPWLNLEDPQSPALDTIAAQEGFHPLEVEDCRHRNQIAKVSEQENYIFIVIKTIRFVEDDMSIEFD